MWSRQWISDEHEQESNVDADMEVANRADRIHVSAVIAAYCRIPRWKHLRYLSAEFAIGSPEYLPAGTSSEAGKDPGKIVLARRTMKVACSQSQEW